MASIESINMLQYTMKLYIQEVLGKAIPLSLTSKFLTQSDLMGLLGFVP